jgi:hypothetical protein
MSINTQTTYKGNIMDNLAYYDDSEEFSDLEERLEKADKTDDQIEKELFDRDMAQYVNGLSRSPY